jgi:hypothetical protein
VLDDDSVVFSIVGNH